MKWILSVVVCCLSVSLSAQTNDSSFSKKEKPRLLPFEIHSHRAVVDSVQLKMWNQKVRRNLSVIEPYFYYNERRVINILDSDFYIELFSAKEIGEMMHSSIQPEMVKGEQQGRSIAVAVVADGKLTAKIVE